MKPLALSCLLCLALCSVLGSASYSTHDSLLGASGDLQISSEYDDLEKERMEDMDMTLPKVHLGLEDMGESGLGSGRGRNRRKGKDRKKNKKAFTPSQRHHSTHTHTSSGSSSSSYTTVEDLCFTTHRDFCVHGQCKFMEDLREPLCICQVGFEGKRCAVQLMKTGHREEEEEEDDETHAHTALLVIAVMLSIISCSALLLTICVHYKTQRRFQAAFFNTDEKETPLKNNMI
ncbi:proheparin-binding EGF-like growth factor [Engraulis encrasicolus]|uniref:proheparin-binding EGF-like growth factor n=1 Tax=Engraulis encrasicolus TaxID=184585 RepID=UPI002FCF3765